MQDRDNPTRNEPRKVRKSSVERAAAKLAAGRIERAGSNVEKNHVVGNEQVPAPPSAVPAPPLPDPAPPSADKDGGNGAPRTSHNEAKPISRDEAQPTRLDDKMRTSRRISMDVEGMRKAGIVTAEAEGSLIAEEFRLIKRPLLLKAFDKATTATKNGNLIMVSSSAANEGKTFCSINLAMSIALERDLTVLLVDADLAKPAVTRVLGFEAEKGLVDILNDEALDLSDVLVRTDLDNLTILPAGSSHHLATELLASERMERLVEDIAQRYSDRVIIFDSPPALVSSIPSVLALHVGQTVYVVQADQTTQAVIDAGLGLISACKNIYLLLNKARAVGDPENFGAYYSYYSR